MALIFQTCEPHSPSKCGKSVIDSLAVLTCYKLALRNLPSGAYCCIFSVTQRKGKIGISGDRYDPSSLFFNKLPKKYLTYTQIFSPWPGACCFQYFPSDKAMCDLRPCNTRDEYLQNNVSEMSCADCTYTASGNSLSL